MNPFIQHPHKQGVSYLDHMVFAMSIASRLFRSVIAFAVHAIFPFIDIQRSLDLEATAQFIEKKNDWIEQAKKAKKQASPQPDHDSNSMVLDL